MGFQSSLLAAGFAIGGAIGGVQKGLNEYTARQEKAQEKVKKVKEAKEQQKTKRRNFMKDYLSKQETSLGGRVGDLPEHVQKKIAAQFSKSQRKEMMDRMDREALKNDKE